MKERTRKIFIMIVMAALIVSLMAASFAALTYGRYSGGRRDENSAYEDILDLVGETAFEVSTADELVNAINNGYSYIKVVGDDPTLVVNNNVADVVVNLVLDVNGHKIVRNSRNPLLNVRQSVSVVLVYDSSEKAEGGFYNPVGSALQTSGGTLTVGEGVYESGPRTGIGLDFSYTVSATVCSRDGRKAASYSVQKTDQTFPKLTEKTGDVYFDENYSGTGDYLKADTYLIYTEEKNAFVGDGNGSGKFEDGQLYVNRKETSSGETTTITADKFSPICDVASCDFYYYYPVGTAGTANSPQTYAVVYGYNEVKGLAKTKNENLTSGNETNLVWPYAAIRSEAGNTHARGGEFYTYFGEENTYSIYSEGGTMTVGLSGESDPPKFQAIGKGVCINMAGTSGNADQTLTIENGEFSSKIGDTIKMSGGEMEVKKGSFTKDATVLGAASGDGASNGSAISISGGTLTSSDTEDTSKPIQFHISGSYVNGIYAKGGEVNIANATFAFENGKNNQGVYNDGGTSRAHWCDFTLPGDNNYGIHSTNGTTRASDCAITMTGEYAVGVYTTGGRALVEGGSINVGFADGKSDNLLTSAAVSTEGGEIYLAGSLTIESRSLGVTVRKVEETEGSLEIATDTITTGDGKKYEGITPGNVTIETPNATGIYINNGSLTNKGTVTVKSSVGNQYGTDQGWSWVDENGSAISDFNKYNGVYVQGGSLVSEGELNVTFTGVQNDAYGSGANSNLTPNTAYRDFQIKSYAVRVEAAASGGDTKVSIAGGTISNSVGGGVYVGGGKVTLGVEKGNKGPTVQTTGTSVEDTICNPFNYGGNWEYQLPQTGGPAVKVAGGESTTIYGGEYRSQQGDGIVTTGGSATISQGTFYGNDSYDTKAGPGASYSFKVYGGTVTVKDGTFGSSDASGGGAFVAGTAQETAKAQINGGKFLSGGQAAFSILDNATVTFGEDDAANITVQGSKAGLVLEGYSGIGSPEITINGGNFSSTSIDDNESSAIWSGNPNFKLTINGGELTGEAKDGIFIARRTWNKESDPFIGTLKITGGEITGNTHGLNLDRDIKSENAVEISGNAVLTGSTGSGLNLAGALYAPHAVVITGGTFVGGQYGAYYGKDGGDDGVYINDGLLIMGGTFTGTPSAGVGFFFGVNPWSQKVEGFWPIQEKTPYNNVAIVGGTFSSFGANDESIKVGDVFTMHVEYNGKRQYGVDEDNGVYGNAGAGEGAVVKVDLNKQITLTPTTNS